MATYDDLFGAGAKSSRKYIKFTEVGEGFYFVVTDEPVRKHPEIDFTTRKPKYIVQYKGEAKGSVRLEGTFDPNDEKLEYATRATTLMVPVKVFRHILPDGTDEEGFEEFDAEWLPNKVQMDKLKDEMLEHQIPLIPGTIVAVKFLSKSEKPYKFTVRIAAGE